MRLSSLPPCCFNPHILTAVIQARFKSPTGELNVIRRIRIQDAIPPRVISKQDPSVSGRIGVGRCKIVQERTAVKLLLDGDGVILSFTTRRRAFFFFLSRVLIGLRTAPTTDPDLGIVELSGYEIPSIVKNWDRMSLLSVKRRSQGPHKP